MGIADPALRYDASAANPLRTPFIEDIFLLFGAGEDVTNIAGRPRTSAARDFVRMQPRGPRYSRSCATSTGAGSCWRDASRASRYQCSRRPLPVVKESDGQRQVQGKHAIQIECARLACSGRANGNGGVGRSNR